MSTWLQILLGIAAGLTALATIFRLVISPMAKLVTLQQAVMPLQRELVRVFGGEPTRLDVLDEIASQFKTDSGSSLRDVVNRLEDAATENSNAADMLKIRVEAVRVLAGEDREKIQRLLFVLETITIQINKTGGGVLRIEAAAKSVADDLAASHRNADAIEGHPGEAADAASRTPEPR